MFARCTIAGDTQFAQDGRRICRQRHRFIRGVLRDPVLRRRITSAAARRPSDPHGDGENALVGFTADAAGWAWPAERIAVEAPRRIRRIARAFSEARSSSSRNRADSQYADERRVFAMDIVVVEIACGASPSHFYRSTSSSTRRRDAPQSGRSRAASARDGYLPEHLDDSGCQLKRREVFDLPPTAP